MLKTSHNMLHELVNDLKIKNCLVYNIVANNLSLECCSDSYNMGPQLNLVFSDH